MATPKCVTPQLFNFHSSEIRVVMDEEGDPWFVAKDAADAMSILNSRDVVAGLDDDEKKLVSVKSTSGQARKMQLVSESGLYEIIFSSNKPEAKAFKRWIRKDVLPSIRKTGSYSIRKMILPEPASWERTFPSEFMRQVMRIHGYDYKPETGTHSWVGKFINKYVYGWMDKDATTELKAARSQWSGDDETAFLHQFLNGQGRGLLKDHLIGMVVLLKTSHNPEHFDSLFNESFARANQLKISFR